MITYVTLGEVNNKIFGSFSGKGAGLVNAIGWLVFGIVILACAGFGFWYYLDRKKFNKKVVAYGIVNGFYIPVYNDVAKSVKLGKGGFEILYLKKMKTWKLANGARTGANTYNFYIQPDGYWYPGQISADIKTISKDGGLISIVTTNPNMRGQYTSLEKQIDSLHDDKKGFWDKYGNWVLSIAFILIIGVLGWLMYREMHTTMASIANVADQMNKLGETLNRLAVNIDSRNNGGSGLTPV